MRANLEVNNDTSCTYKKMLSLLYMETLRRLILWQILYVCFSAREKMRKNCEGTFPRPDRLTAIDFCAGKTFPNLSGTRIHDVLLEMLVSD